MGTVLFLNTDRKIEEKWFKKIQRKLPKSDFLDLYFFYEGKVEELPGENYYFDCMWVPFCEPLTSFVSCFEGKDFEQCEKIIKVIGDVILLLLKKGYPIKLCQSGIENAPPLNPDMQKLRVSDLDENRVLEWVTVYEIVE